MSDIRHIRNSDLPLIVASSASWLGLTHLMPEARLQLFDLGLFSKPTFEFENCWVSQNTDEIDAIVIAAQSPSKANVVYANSSLSSLDALEATLKRSLKHITQIGADCVGTTKSSTEVLAHVPGIIENSGTRASVYQLRDFFIANDFTQLHNTPLLTFNTETQRPAFSREQMELRRTHAIATTHDIVLPDWSLNFELGHLSTLEIQLKERESGQSDASAILTAIPDGHPSQSTVAIRSCQGTEPYLTALLSDLCRGHQGTISATLPNYSETLQAIGFEICDSMVAWQRD